MATIEPYTLKSGVRRYRVRYRMPDHRQTDKRGFTTKRAAEAFAATVEVEKLRGEYVPPALGTVTVAELGPTWLRRKQAELKPSGYRVYEVAWRVHVEPRWGRTSIANVKAGAVETWIAEMQRTVTEPEERPDGTRAEKVVHKGAGAVTVIRAYGVLSGILDQAVKDGRLAKNPARGVTNLPSKPRKKAGRRYLTATELRAVADACQTDERRALVLLLGFLGLRWGEAIALTVADVDFLRKRITISRNAVQVGQRVHVGTPKTGEARSVPLPQFLGDELARLCEGRERGDLLFPGVDGAHLRQPVAAGKGSWLEGACSRAGIARVTPHDLRHTAASIAVGAGANPLALQRMLGHAKPSMTLDVYSDLFDTDLDALGDTLNHVGTVQSVGRMWARGADPAV